MFYRLRQLIWAIKSNNEEVDELYLKKYLSVDELNLFYRLSKIDQHHSIRVSKEALNILKNEFNDEKLKSSDSFKSELAKTGLLHDIGKSKYPLNPLNKVLVVLIDKLTKSKLKNKSKLKIIDIYYNHPKEGKKILINSKLKFSEDLLEAVESHHKNNNYIQCSNNSLLKIIKLADDRN